MNIEPGFLLAAYCACIVAGSLAGGWLPLWVHLNHTRLQTLMSFVAGLMLGVGLLHLLPHAALQLGSLDRAVGYTLAGLLGMFFLVRAFHFHQHGEWEAHEVAPSSGATHEQADAPARSHHPHDGHGCEHDHKHVEPAGRRGRWGWAGIFLGLALHTLLDGVALSASLQAERMHAGGGLLAVGTFLAILLHKPLDALSITSLMAHGGWPRHWQLAVNVAFAIACPLGASWFWFGMDPSAGGSAAVIGVALAISAGVFLCISLGDLLPELQFHHHDRLKLSLALLLGVGLAWAIGWFEPPHVHGVAVPSAAAEDAEQR